MFIVFTDIVIPRLINGSTMYEGRVEVYYKGVWLKACDDEWDFIDADLVCRCLGFGPAIIARKQAYYGQGISHPWLCFDVFCIGNESVIEACPGVLRPECHSCLDAGVKCAAPNGNSYFTFVYS